MNLFTTQDPVVKRACITARIFGAVIVVLWIGIAIASYNFFPYLIGYPGAFMVLGAIYLTAFLWKMQDRAWKKLDNHRSPPKLSNC